MLIQIAWSDYHLRPVILASKNVILLDVPQQSSPVELIH